ncbi:MAG: glycosyltransferase family 2 protein [Cyclobacteriaceae bacterium]|nr:glycosyltransferase family 2 protein [Cyclobacteriaceae bacterium]
MSARHYHIAVILINYNSTRYTINCINSIQKNTDPTLHYQIIVVDNNSREEEFDHLISGVDQTKIIVVKSRLNVGFSGANMMGVQVADADYYYFLNNDCLLLNDCLKILYTFMESEPRVANCSGEMFNSEGVYEYNFRYFPTLKLKLLGSSFLRLFSPADFPDKYTRLTKPTRVDLVNGSSMFVRATSFEEIGGFDTNYFLYCEEEDLALRLRRTGWLTYLVPDARYQHFENKSSETNSPIRLPFLREFYISLLYYYSKNYNGVYRICIQTLLFFKLARKFYKHLGYAQLAFFVVRGAPVKYSLRFKQRIK